jgi:hypothetical protein
MGGGKDAAVGGVGLMSGGATVSATGVGAVAGVPTAALGAGLTVGGAAVAVHGTAVVGQSLSDIGADINAMTSSGGGEGQKVRPREQNLRNKLKMSRIRRLVPIQIPMRAVKHTMAREPVNA